MLAWHPSLCLPHGLPACPTHLPACYCSPADFIKFGNNPPKPKAAAPMDAPAPAGGATEVRPATAKPGSPSQGTAGTTSGAGPAAQGATAAQVPAGRDVAVAEADQEDVDGAKGGAATTEGAAVAEGGAAAAEEGGAAAVAEGMDIDVVVAEAGGSEEAAQGAG